MICCCCWACVDWTGARESGRNACACERETESAEASRLTRSAALSEIGFRSSSEQLKPIDHWGSYPSVLYGDVRLKYRDSYCTLAFLGLWMRLAG